MQRLIFIIEVYIFIIIVLMPKGYAGVNKYTPFGLTLKKEAILTVTGVSFQQIGNCILSRMTVTDTTKIKKSNVNSYDRFACKYYSKKLSYLSDNTKDATTILLALSLFSHLKTIFTKFFGL